MVCVDSAEALRINLARTIPVTQSYESNHFLYRITISCSERTREPIRKVVGRSCQTSFMIYPAKHSALVGKAPTRALGDFRTLVKMILPVI